MRYFLTFFCILLCTQSCVITKTPGFYTGYKRLGKEEKKQFIFLPEDSMICSLPVNHYNIYVVNGTQLRQCLSSNDSSVVYIWGPRCTSRHCILIKAAQEFCTRHDYQLYVVAEYYDAEMMNSQNYSDFPMLIANQMYYNRNYANCVNRRFEEDLIHAKQQLRYRKDNPGRFLIFKGDSLVETRLNLFES